MTPVIPLFAVFESDRFLVVANDSMDDPCYEVVRKPAGWKTQADDDNGVAYSAYLYGDAAKLLLDQTRAWQFATPSQSEVEEFLERLTVLNTWPLTTN